MATITTIRTTNAAQFSVRRAPLPFPNGDVFRLVGTDCESVGNVRSEFLVWDMDRETAQLLYDRLAVALGLPASHAGVRP